MNRLNRILMNCGFAMLKPDQEFDRFVIRFLRSTEPLDVLEEEVEIQGKTWYVGHSKEYIKTAVPKEDGYTVNDIITVKADHFLEEHILTGEVL